MRNIRKEKKRKEKKRKEKKNKRNRKEIEKKEKRKRKMSKRKIAKTEEKKESRRQVFGSRVSPYISQFAFLAVVDAGNRGLSLRDEVVVVDVV